MGSAVTGLGGPVFIGYVLRRGSLPFEVVRDVMRALLACDEDFERLRWGPESKQVRQCQHQELVRVDFLLYGLAGHVCTQEGQLSHSQRDEKVKMVIRTNPAKRMEVSK